VLEGQGELLVDGSEGLAVAAPGSEELDEGRLAGLENNVIEVVGDEVEDRRFGGSGGREASEHEALDEHHDDGDLVVFDSCESRRIRRRRPQCNSRDGITTAESHQEEIWINLKQTDGVATEKAML
jgi:hypothetical protein